jgi:hypothetical protein
MSPLIILQSGRYAATSGGLAVAVTNGSLKALDNLGAGGNGVYTYGFISFLPFYLEQTQLTIGWMYYLLLTPVILYFHLTSVTDSTGLTKSGTLQTLTVTLTDCPQGLRSAGAVAPVVENKARTLSPVTKELVIPEEEIKNISAGAKLS